VEVSPRPRRGVGPWRRGGPPGTRVAATAARQHRSAMANNIARRWTPASAGCSSQARVRRARRWPGVQVAHAGPRCAAPAVGTDAGLDPRRAHRSSSGRCPDRSSLRPVASCTTSRRRGGAARAAGPGGLAGHSGASAVLHRRGRRAVKFAIQFAWPPEVSPGVPDPRCRGAGERAAAWSMSASTPCGRRVEEAVGRWGKPPRRAAARQTTGGDPSCRHGRAGPAKPRASKISTSGLGQQDRQHQVNVRVSQTCVHRGRLAHGGHRKQRAQHRMPI